MNRIPIFALLAALAAAQAPPASAQQASWYANQIAVTQGRGAICQPTITSASGSVGNRRFRVAVTKPVDGSITTSLSVTLVTATQRLSYSGARNLYLGDGEVEVTGPVIPASLAGSRLEINVLSCIEYPRGS